MNSSALRRVLMLVASFLFLSSSFAISSSVQKLPSGKEITILGMGKMNFAKDDPALMLKYETDISIDNFNDLRSEAEEVWSLFRVNAEKSGLPGAILSANEKSDKNAFISTNKSFSFVVTKNNNGGWEFSDVWKRNYEQEIDDIAKKYFDLISKGKNKVASYFFHCPESYTKEDIDNERKGITKLISIISDELGTPTSFQKSNYDEKYLSSIIQSGTIDFWKSHPMFIRRVYEVNYSKAGKGYLTLALSIINNNLVIYSIENGLPVESGNAETKISKLFSRFSNEMK